MDGLSLETFIGGPLLNNCYLVLNRSKKEAFLIDSPWDSGEVINFIKDQNIEIKFILLTHAHFDHIAGLNSFNSPFYLHKQDIPLLESPDFNGSFLFGSEILVKKEPSFYGPSVDLTFAGHKIEVIDTPGHTPGSVCLKLDNWLFSGDTLFFDSVGRTDVPLGSTEKLISSINEKIMVLPDELKVFPGHGASTTLGREKEHNPFLQSKNS